MHAFVDKNKYVYTYYTDTHVHVTTRPTFCMQPYVKLQLNEFSEAEAPPLFRSETKCGKTRIAAVCRD